MSGPIGSLAEALCRASHEIDSPTWFPCPDHRAAASAARSWLREWADSDLVDAAIRSTVTKARDRGFTDDEQATAVVREFLSTLRGGGA